MTRIGNYVSLSPEAGGARELGREFVELITNTHSGEGKEAKGTQGEAEEFEGGKFRKRVDPPKAYVPWLASMVIDTYL